MPEHGKRYRTARENIDRERLYSPLEAIRLLKSAPPAKFDETVEVHFNTGLNVRHAEQQLRGTLMLPHGTGKDTRVAVFAEGEKAKEAQEAGADVVGAADLAAQIEGGFDDFDVTIATPGHDGHGRQARPHPRPARQDAEPEGRHGDLRRRPRPFASRRPESSSTEPTAAPTSICRSAAAASTSASCSRTTQRSSTRSCGPSPPPRRAATSSRSRSRARWAPESRSTRRARATWSPSWRSRRRRPSPSYPRALSRPRQLAALRGRSPAEAARGEMFTSRSSPPSCGPSCFRR